MNKQKLRSMCMKVSKEAGLSFNVVQTHYFLEKILKKIANSKEKHNFIFKGGFLLSNVIGISERSTIDIDFLIRKFTLTEENIRDKFLEILKTNKNESITYEIVKIEGIRKEDEYGGYCISVLCRLENIKQIIQLDIATGDPITPNEIEYEYKCVFDGELFNIAAYNIETILAEKIQTIYNRGFFNSRSKDFYDVYILYKLKKKDINIETLKSACFNTFNYRETEFDKDKIISLLDDLAVENNFNIRWKNYQKKFSYARGIKFDELIKDIKELLGQI